MGESPSVDFKVIAEGFLHLCLVMAKEIAIDEGETK
jgi:hypothetical protein